MPILDLIFNGKPATKGAKEAEAAGKKVQKSATKTESSMKKLGAAMAAVWLSGKLKRGFMTMIDLVSTQEKTIAQLNAGLKSTNGISGQTIGSIRKLSAEMQQLTIYSNESVESAAAILLSFTGIADDVFPRVVKATADVATRMGQDLNSTMVQLGKALNDPVANLGALSRSGIQFSKSQKELIKSLWETGRQAEAQRVILAELENQYGGSAAAAKDTLGGAITGLKNNFNDLVKVIGQGMTGAMTSLISKINESITVMTKFLNSKQGKSIMADLTWMPEKSVLSTVAEDYKKPKKEEQPDIKGLKRPEYEPRQSDLEIINATRAGSDVLREFIGLQKEEQRYAKMSADERERAILKLKAETEAREKLKEAWKGITDTRVTEQAFMKSGEADIERQLENLDKEIKLVQKLKAENKDVKESFVDWTGAASSGLTDIVTGAQDAQKALTQFANSITRMAVQASFSSIFSGGPKVAKGAVFSGGSMVPFAKGGVVTRPTVFPMAKGGTGLMGEAGPEAVMPLKRNDKGELGVEGGGSNFTINLSVNSLTADPYAIANAVSNSTVIQTIRAGLLNDGARI